MENLEEIAKNLTLEIQKMEEEKTVTSPELI